MAKLEFGQSDDNEAQSAVRKSSSRKPDSYEYEDDSEPKGFGALVKTWKFWATAGFAFLVFFTLYLNYPG